MAEVSGEVRRTETSRRAIPVSWLGDASQGVRNRLAHRAHALAEG